MRARIFRGLAGVLAALLCLSIVAVSVENSRESFLNSRLGTVTNRIVDSSGQYVTYYDSEFASTTELVAAKKELARQISAEGSVLLKNENGALPLDLAADTVTLWGLNSHTPTLGGMIGSTPDSGESEAVRLYGIEEAMAETGFTLNQDMLAFYAGSEASAYLRHGFGGGGPLSHGLIPSFTATYEAPAVYMVGEAPASLYDDALLATADGTVAVAVISRDSSEAADYAPFMINLTEGDSFERPLALSDYEREMLNLAKAHSSKVIVLLNADNPMEIQELKDDSDIDAILWTGEPGTYGFLGVCDVLSGAASPSGSLPDTYAVNSTSSPAMVNFGLYEFEDNFHQAGESSRLTEADKAEWFVVENEGIYNGYKYYETRYEDAVLGRGNAGSAVGSTSGSGWSYADEVSYPFGFGLSYTSFDLSLDSLNVELGSLGDAAVTVTNTGDTAGRCPVQLYVQAPYTAGGVEKAAIQFIGFAKTSELAPGDSETVHITVDPAYFASYDTNQVNANGTQGAWILDAGDYYFSVGNGAHEALNNVLAVKTGSEEGLVSVNEETVSEDRVAVWTLGEKDIETYSAGVENRLESADLNAYIPGAVDYVTRSDWTKGWTPIHSLPITDDMLPGLKNARYPLTESDSDVTWGAYADTNIAEVRGLAYDDPLLEELMDQVTLDEAIHFVAYGGDDLEKIDSIVLPKTYMNDGPLGFAYDQVAGYATRWTATDEADPNYVSAKDPNAKTAMCTMPTEPVVSATMNIELIQREGELIGEDGLWANESVLIGPGVNLHRTPYCARNHEYYSEDSFLTAYCTAAFCAGAESKGLLTQVKHFAFNHQETNRSGIATFFNEQAGRENELRCFQLAMSSNVTSSSMTAFNRVGVDFAGAYRPMLVGIARDEWGYEGAFVTDMINGADYMNWRDVVLGGGGICLTATAYNNSNIGLMEDSRAEIAGDGAFQQELREGVKHWVYVLSNSNAVNGISTTTEIQSVTPWWRVLTAVLGVLFVLGLGACIMMLMPWTKMEPALPDPAAERRSAPVRSAGGPRSGGAVRGAAGVTHPGAKGRNVRKKKNARRKK